MWFGLKSDIEAYNQLAGKRGVFCPTPLRIIILDQVAFCLYENIVTGDIGAEVGHEGLFEHRLRQGIPYCRGLQLDIGPVDVLQGRVARYARQALIGLWRGVVVGGVAGRPVIEILRTVVTLTGGIVAA